MAVRHDRLPKAASPVLSRRSHDAVLAAIVGGLLIGFAVVVVREVLATFGVIDGGKGDQYQLFAVSLTGLAGGIFTVALRAGPRQISAGVGRVATVDALRSSLATAFALAYVTAGTVAVVVCLVRLGDATSLLKSLAATFLGTSVAAATSLFGAADPTSS